MARSEPMLWQSHEVVHPNQLVKLRKMDRLMFDCWRMGYKRSKILALAQEIDSATTLEDVGVYFHAMFRRELSPSARYLRRSYGADRP